MSHRIFNGKGACFCDAHVRKKMHMRVAVTRTVRACSSGGFGWQVVSNIYIDVFAMYVCMYVMALLSWGIIKNQSLYSVNKNNVRIRRQVYI